MYAFQCGVIAHKSDTAEPVFIIYTYANLYKCLIFLLGTYCDNIRKYLAKFDSYKNLLNDVWYKNYLLT